MNTSKKAEFTTSIRHIDRLSKWGIPIYNSEVPEMSRRGKKGHCKAVHFTSKCNKLYKIRITLQLFAFYSNPSLTLVQWLSLFFHSIQQSQKLDTVQVQVLLVTFRVKGNSEPQTAILRAAMQTVYKVNAFWSANHSTKLCIIIIIILTIIIIKTSTRI